VAQRRVLEVKTNIGCNLGCSYCPQAAINRAFKSHVRSDRNRFFTAADFATCLSTVPTAVDVHFSGFSEPWHHADATDFVLHAHDKGHLIGVFTTADKMTIGDLDRMEHIPFKRFTVHLPDADKMMRLAIVPQYLDLLRAMKDRNICGLDFMTIGRLDPVITEILGVTNATKRVHSRASNITVREEALVSSPSEQALRARTKGKSISCRRNRILANVVVPGGGVYLCSMDYALEAPLGNLLQHSYADIVGGDAFRGILANLKDPQGEVICRKCEYAIAGSYV
jgi:Iron-sulfur cluster-binding domain